MIRSLMALKAASTNFISCIAIILNPKMSGLRCLRPITAVGLSLEFAQEIAMPHSFTQKKVRQKGCNSIAIS